MQILNLTKNDLLFFIENIYHLENSLKENFYNFNQIEQFFSYEYYDIFIFLLNTINYNYSIIKIKKNEVEFLEQQNNYIHFDKIKIVGYALFQLDKVDRILELHKILIHQDFRNRGKGYEFLKKIIAYYQSYKQYKKILLEVAEDNIAALNLYKKLNFLPISIRKQYYANKKNAIIMMLEL
jgi:ribosomal-protein-alanine N-acetyltransferase